jgi:alkaline phosphatase D
MVVICGDRHWQYLSIHPKTGVREYSCGPASNQHSGGWAAKRLSQGHPSISQRHRRLSLRQRRPKSG